MGCFSFCSSKTPSSKSPPPPITTTTTSMSNNEYDQQKNIRHQTLIRIPQCKVHLMDEGEAVEIAEGEFSLTKIHDGELSLATIVRVGDDLSWPLTKDEPVVRLDSLSYLFSLPVTHGDPLSYGLTFDTANSLASLDDLLRLNSCFSGLSPSTKTGSTRGIDWKEFAPRVEDYNNVLARAIAGGTGQIVKGIFKCSNAYSNQVQKGGQMTLTSARGVEDKNGMTRKEKDMINNNNNNGSSKKKSGLNKNLKRVRKLSKMTEKLSKTMLDGVGIATGAVMGSVMKSESGKAFLNMVPGEVLLASLDAVNKILDAAEAAEKQALSATSTAATRMVSNRFGESAGEATGDVLATAGHCAGTAWNVFKIRKALNPASSVSSGMLKSAAKSTLKS